MVIARTGRHLAIRHGLLASVALAGCNLSPFVCADDSSCSQRDEGQCEANGTCSYPDPDCGSGRRYSTYGPADEGLCVPAEDPNATTREDESSSTSSDATTTLELSTTSSSTTTGSTGEDDSSSSGDMPDACGGCSGLGACVVVDGDPTCACDPGWTMVGLECLEDPCATETCYFVDSEQGNDDGPGSRDEPWETRDRAAGFLNGAAPGDHILFRRGRTFEGTAVTTITATGTSAAPIVLGAYGPPDEAAPILPNLSLNLRTAEHLVLRDVSIRGTGRNPCLFVENSGYVTVHDAEFSQCGNRGIRISDRTHHNVLFRNEIHDVGDRVGIYAADTPWTMPTPTFLGEHHWLAGNTVRNTGEEGIRALFVSTDHDPGEVGDIKIVDNQLSSTGEAGIVVRSPVAWVSDNIVIGSNPAPPVYTSAVLVDNGTAWAHVRGNIIAGTDGALLLRGNAQVEQNSFFQLEGVNSTVAVEPGTGAASLVDNVIFTDQGIHAQGNTGILAALSQIDRNVYAATSEGACAFEVGVTSVDFAQWQEATEDEGSSRCEVVPGLAAPPQTSVPVDDGFVLGIAPRPRWRGCESAGAVSCDGQRRPLVFQASDDVDENAGRGWEGPLIIQQHYPLDR